LASLAAGANASAVGSAGAIAVLPLQFESCCEESDEKPEVGVGLAPHLATLLALLDEPPPPPPWAFGKSMLNAPSSLRQHGKGLERCCGARASWRLGPVR